MADKQSRAARVKIDIDISDALTGLKALQREARKATQALRELEAVNSGLTTVVDSDGVTSVLPPQINGVKKYGQGSNDGSVKTNAWFSEED